MKIYISSHDSGAGDTLATTLIEAGHEIVSTWHCEAAIEGQFVKTPEWWRERAAENFARIHQADALVLIGGADRYPGGKYVEAGYANGQGIQVYNLGEVGNGLMNFAVRVNDVADLLAAL